MAKLSSREKAAKKAGGTLNYKTGKISVPVKKSPVRSTSTSKPSGKVAIASNADGTVRYSDGTSSNPYASNVGETAGIVEARFNAQEAGVLPKSTPKKASKASSSSSPKKSSNRALSAGVNSALGIPTANASSSPKLVTTATHDTNTLGNIVSSLGRAAMGVPGLIYKGVTGNTPDLGLTEALGLSKESPNLTYNLGTEAVVDPATGRSIPPSLGGGSSTLTDQSLADASLFGAPGIRSQAANDYIAQRTRTPKVIPGYSPTQISGVQNYSPSTQISQGTEQNFTPAQDFTPIVQEQPGTQRRFLGNGMLSNGMASNGAGNYGIQGSLTGTGLDEQTLLNQLLGIPTAQAQEVQDFGTTEVSPQEFQSTFQNAFASGGLSGTNPFAQASFGQPSSFNPTNQVQTNANQSPQITQRSNPGGSQSGGVAQQYSQGETGGSPLEGYYKKQQKGYSAQEKAQKKALNELLKSIKSQYSNEEAQGTTKLEKSKQEDLLKLSGLFNFANQDPNSEQRIQYQNRLSQDYATQLTDYLQQISQQRGQAISQAKQGYQGQLADIAQQRNASSLELMKLQQQLQSDALDRASKGSSGGTQKAGSITYIGNDASGNPVYYNSTTGQQQSYPGVTRPSSNPLAALFGQLGMQSAGSWELDPQTGEQVFVTN